MSEEQAATTEAERVRRALAQQRDDLQLILDAIPAFVFYKDTNNRILRVNRAVAESLGVRADDMTNTETARWYPDEAAVYFQDDLEVISSGRPKLGIVEPLGTSTPDKRWISTDKFPQCDGQGRVTGIVVIATDITERLRLEQQLLQAQKLDSIGRLAGGVAHDFNNLLTALLGHLELARRLAQPTDRIQEHLEAIRIAAARGTDLTRQLLAFARKQLIEPRVVDLNEIARDAERLLARVIGANVELRVEVSPEPARVRVDPGQITQVLLNMALNGRDAMHGGGVLTVTVHCTDSLRVAGPEWSRGRVVVMSIRDTGEGFSDESREHLFEPFFTTKPKGQGTGLGLATSYGIVKQNGGHIAVSSRKGEGTTFDIILPEAQDKPASKGSDGDMATPPPASGATILLVDDDDALRSVLKTMLVEVGHHVIDARDGIDAIERAQRLEGPVHLLVTDVAMPRMGGAELARRMRQSRPSLRVLFISGYTDGTIGADELSAGGARFLSKPFSPKELHAVVAASLDPSATAK